jgi:GntR family transcriptional regulator
MEIRLRKKIPLYIQIENLIKSKIHMGELKEGSRLSPENELSKQFGVSPLTVRQALSSLVQEGYLDRKAGKGTIVRKSPAGKMMVSLSGEIDDLLSLGMKTEIEVLRYEVIKGRDKATQSLQLKQTDSIYFVEKLRYWEKKPIMVIEEYVRQSLIGNLSNTKKLAKSLYFTLTQKKGITLKEATQTIESTTADQRIASLLQIEMGSPLFYMERTFFEENGLPILFQVTFTRAEHFKFSVHLGREQKEKEIKWVLY